MIIALHGVDGSGWTDGSIRSDLLDQVCAYLKKSNTYVSTSDDLGLYEYLYANATLIVNKISNSYIEIIPKLPDLLRYPDGWRKEITVVIPIGNISEVINFDFKKDTKISISANGIYVQ